MERCFAGRAAQSGGQEIKLKQDWRQKKRRWKKSPQENAKQLAAKRGKGELPI